VRHASSSDLYLDPLLSLLLEGRREKQEKKGERRGERKGKRKKEDRREQELRQDRTGKEQLREFTRSLYFTVFDIFVSLFVCVSYTAIGGRGILPSYTSSLVTYAGKMLFGSVPTSFFGFEPTVF